MNYRHGYHAGNFADVVKHLALVVILQHLKKKDTAFAVVDSHAGRGVYDLTGEEAAKTGEARGGLARLINLPDEMPPAPSSGDRCRRIAAGRSARHRPASNPGSSAPS